MLKFHLLSLPNLIGLLSRWLFHFIFHLCSAIGHVAGCFPFSPVYPVSTCADLTRLSACLLNRLFLCAALALCSVVSLTVSCSHNRPCLLCLSPCPCLSPSIYFYTSSFVHLPLSGKYTVSRSFLILLDSACDHTSNLSRTQLFPLRTQVATANRPFLCLSARQLLERRMNKAIQARLGFSVGTADPDLG